MTAILFWSYYLLVGLLHGVYVLLHPRKRESVVQQVKDLHWEFPFLTQNTYLFWAIIGVALFWPAVYSSRYKPRL